MAEEASRAREGVSRQACATIGGLSASNRGNARDLPIVPVEDHGIGIGRSELKDIFEPFYRSSEARAAQIHGTGLGLSLARHLAEAMGGRLSVRSEIGLGSVFTLHLQLAQSGDPRSHSINAEVSQVGK